MDQIYKERFLKMYNHMKQPQSKLVHKKFDFSRFNTRKNRRGTIGCMAGELPIAFPDQWYFDWCKEVRIIGSLYFDVKVDLEEFFNITSDEVEHLFYPLSQSPEIDPYFINHSYLEYSSTKKQVVKNLRRFLVIKNIL